MSADWDSVSSWGSLLDFPARLLDALVVVESRRVSGCHCSLLSFCGHCYTGGGLSSCSEVIFPLDVLQEERLVSLKIGVAIDLKGNESLLPCGGWEPFLPALLSTTVLALPKYGDKVSSFLACYEALACCSSLDVLLALPDIKWPLRVWSHPCRCCLRGFMEHDRPCFLLFH